MNLNPDALIQQMTQLVTVYGLRIVFAVVILLIGRWIARSTSRIVEHTMMKREVDPTVCQFVARLLSALIMVFAVIAALSNVGIQTASIIAALGAAGLAVGLALQGSLSNFAAGVLLVMFRPCRVGDYVEAGGCGGTVQHISLFQTILITPDNKQIVIPNSNVMSGPITNYSAMPTRRVELKIGISYDSDIKKAKQLLADMIAGDQRILPDPASMIAVAELADSSVNLVARAWVNSADYWAVFFDMNENAKLLFDANGISIPFPQMDVHLDRPVA